MTSMCRSRIMMIRLLHVKLESCQDDTILVLKTTSCQFDTILISNFLKVKSCLGEMTSVQFRLY